MATGWWLPKRRRAQAWVALRARACQVVDRWLEQADGTDRQRALEALQIAVVATRERGTVSGVIPLEPTEFFVAKRASACTFISAKPDAAAAIPFSRSFNPMCA